MPSKAKRVRLVNGRRSIRRSSSRRGYDRPWRKVRAQKLQLDPLCQDCEDRDQVTPAVDVHHIEKVCDRPDLRLAIDNLRSLCKSCHAVRTQRGE